MNKKTLAISVIISGIIGALIFVLIYGFKMLNPLFIDYTFRFTNDLTQHYIGFDYFKDAPWTFPLGNFNTLSYPFMTSVYNTDSLPLFAIFFKIFNPLLPEHYQYFGFWGLLCYILQSILSMLIVRKFCKKGVLGDICAILAGALFVLLPNFNLQMFWHSSLTSHWMILMTLMPLIYYDELSYKNKLIIFNLSAFITASIHPYMVAMCAIITALYCVYDFLISKFKSIKSFTPLFSFCLCAVFVLWIFGGFSLGTGYSAEDLQLCSFNLNSFINPNIDTVQKYSFFIPMLPLKDLQQVEGFAFFGSGILILIFSTIAVFIKDCYKKTIPDKIKKNKTLFLVLFATIVISIFIALSPEVTFGDKTLFILPLNKKIYDFWSIFRATGRFIFIASNLILIVCCMYILTRCKKQTALILFSAALIFQTADFKFLKEKHADITRKMHYKPKTDMKLYQNILKKHKNIQIIHVVKDVEHSDIQKLFDIAYIAKNSNLKMGDFYFARSLTNTQQNYYTQIEKQNKNILFIVYKDEEHLKEKGLNYVLIEDLFPKKKHKNKQNK